LEITAKIIEESGEKRRKKKEENPSLLPITHYPFPIPYSVFIS
jgi:hypothetical protein